MNVLLVDLVTNSSVIFHHDTLHSFDEPPLNVPSLCSLDGGIDKTLTPSHSVKEELGGCETGQVGILYETTRLGTVIIFNEMRQRSVLETERDSLSFDILLTYAGNYL